VSAGRQLVDDIALARARAISERTTVHMVFVPPDISNWGLAPGSAKDVVRDQNLTKRLQASPYTSYALYAERTVGDQPGRPQTRYLTSWRTLPDGIFIATNKYQPAADAAAWRNMDDYARPFEFVSLKCPTIFGLDRTVPHLAFNAEGRLVDGFNRPRLQNEVLWLGRGSIMYTRAPGGGVLPGSFDLRESPAGNANNPTNFHRVVVDGLTGRARVENPVIQ
jgi:hypothetical protein